LAVLQIKSQKWGAGMKTLIKNIDTRILIALILICFLIGIFPLSSINVTDMPSGTFFFESITPFPYWIGLLSILGITFYCLRFLDDAKTRVE